MDEACPAIAERRSRPLTIGASAEQRAIEAVRRHYCDYGDSPSWTEIHLETGIHRHDVGRVLRRLAQRALVTIRPGARGIVLVDRAACLSNTELELAVHARGGTLSWPAPIVGPIIDAYPVDRSPDCDLPFADLLCQIDRAEAGEQHDGEAEAQQQAGQRGQTSPA